MYSRRPNSAHSGSMQKTQFSHFLTIELVEANELSSLITICSFEWYTIINFFLDILYILCFLDEVLKISEEKLPCHFLLEYEAFSLPKSPHFWLQHSCTNCIIEICPWCQRYFFCALELKNTFWKFALDDLWWPWLDFDLPWCLKYFFST